MLGRPPTVSPTASWHWDATPRRRCSAGVKSISGSLPVHRIDRVLALCQGDRRDASRLGNSLTLMPCSSGTLRVRSLTGLQPYVQTFHMRRAASFRDCLCSLFVCVFACLVTCLLVCWFARLFMRLLVCLLACWFVRLFACLLIGLLVCWLVRWLIFLSLGAFRSSLLSDGTCTLCTNRAG